MVRRTSQRLKSWSALLAEFFIRFLERAYRWVINGVMARGDQAEGKNPEHSPSDDNDSLAICTIDNRANTALKKGGLTETESVQSQVERQICRLKDQPALCRRLLPRAGMAMEEATPKNKIIAITKRKIFANKTGGHNGINRGRNDCLPRSLRRADRSFTQGLISRSVELFAG